MRTDDWRSIGGRCAYCRLGEGKIDSVRVGPSIRTFHDCRAPPPPEDINNSFAPHSLKGGGCFFDRATLSQGQALLNEAAICFGVLFLAFGVGLDPRAALLFGPRYGPMLVGVSIGVIAFSTSGAMPGYAGAAMNPARCFASGIVRRDMSGELWYCLVVQGARC